MSSKLSVCDVSTTSKPSNHQMSDSIKPGDYVGTKYRGGTRQGIVQEIKDGKVVFKDQHGHVVAHKPSTLAVDPDRSVEHKKDPESAKEEMREEWREEIAAKK
ncbi:hypothetical protein M427DRAFT_151258 [Gonapodya prolifera JEL478]|uniref:Hypervirulence associated protein TUDOR domain-containing protein n=1 Tax=Gonapodya prolifera (strain JEL478) TaxID=1344416 RepID=A0A139AWP3_GONPJ|nr:hypothetical protein M427DRAFT_151258 [Gonapodya prolifera JEL478]|eukprot:KXS21119.1 hypothetical protein M427DRAFT_151258 [Gonapodya prolifera JEL478]